MTLEEADSQIPVGQVFQWQVQAGGSTNGNELKMLRNTQGVLAHKAGQEKLIWKSAV